MHMRMRMHMHMHMHTHTHMHMHTHMAGRLSDPNINPAYLATLVFVGSNLKHFMPAVKDIWQRYLRKFTKNGKACELLENDLGLTTDAPAVAPTDAPAVAPTRALAVAPAPAP